MERRSSRQHDDMLLAEQLLACAMYHSLPGPLVIWITVARYVHNGGRGRYRAGWCCFTMLVAVASLAPTMTATMQSVASARQVASTASAGTAAGFLGMTLAQAPRALRTAAFRAMRSRRGRGDVPDQVAGPFLDYLGATVAVSGLTAVVGAAGVNNYAGAAYVYVRHGPRWSLRAVLTDPLNVPFDHFGEAVALVGTMALIGAPGERKGAGVVYSYVRSGTRWHLWQAIADPSGVAHDSFGTSIALDSTAALIGASGVRHSGGAAYAYARSGGRWRLRATLPDPHGRRNDFFGQAVALSAAIVVVGAWDAVNEGRAYVYVRSGSRWRLQATLSPPGDIPSSFGISVATSGATVLVGADSANGDAGAAYLYTRSATTWNLLATLTDSDGPAADLFGSAVALSGTIAAVGAYGTSLFAGTTYIYVRSGSSWHQNALLRDPNHTAYDSFGGDVTITGSTVLIGASGVNQQAGASYFYVMSGSKWNRQAVLADPRGIPGKSEGAAVAIARHISSSGPQRDGACKPS
jgi:hypothetical protein